MRNPKIGVVSLGCPKNTTDTEVMLGLLSEAGFQITFDNDEADMCLVNTCAFIEEARRESVRALAEMASQGKELIITGCLAQHFKEELMAELPEAHEHLPTHDTRAGHIEVRSQILARQMRRFEGQDASSAQPQEFQCPKKS